VEGIDGKAVERVSILTPVNASHNGRSAAHIYAAAAACVCASLRRMFFFLLSEAKNAANERACDKRTTP